MSEICRVKQIKRRRRIDIFILSYFPYQKIYQKKILVESIVPINAFMTLTLYSDVQ